MKPLANANDEKQPASVTAGRSDESFNFDDLSAQDGEARAPQEESSSETREAKQEQQAVRSPSPSALSTASSGSPLIRSNSSSSSSSSSNSMTAGCQGKHSATGWRTSQQTSGPRRAHNLAPTSIAVAQLQQQQQRQQLAMQQQQQQQQQEKSKSSPKLGKFSSGNKLAQMATSQQQVGEPVNKKNKTPEHEHEIGQGEGKSFGYNFGKMMAHRVSRFNEFWSVNKMRYMNLACLLMTLVCLFTILLFSKSGGTGGGAGASQSLATLDGAAATLSQQQRLKQQHHAYLQQQQQRRRHRFMAAGEEEQPSTTTTTMSGDDEHERPMESIDSIDRQPFVRSVSSGASRKHALAMTSDGVGGSGSGGEDQQPADSTSGAGNINSPDGFNLFDETDSPANGKRSLDDLMQDARRQLKRQQEDEREAEESTTAAAATTTTTTTTGGLTQASTERPPDDRSQTRKLPSIMDPLLSQVLGDLDGFGLFKSIKSQLLEQLNQSTGNAIGSGAELFAAGKPIVRRGKNGATIIMSFGGALSGDKSQTVNGSTSPMGANGSSAPLPSLGSALERLLLPAPLAMMFGGGGGGGAGKLPPAQGFARITINSAEPAIFRSSSAAAEALPLFARAPFMPYESPVRAFTFGPSGPPTQAPSGGFMSMILRASSDLARQMDKQLSRTPAPAAAAAANKTQVVATLGNSTQFELKQEPSQQVKVTFGAPNATENDDTAAAAAADVETFDVGRMLGARLPVSPFHSLYSGARALRPPPLIMIGSSSGGGGADSLSSPFGPMGPPTSPTNAVFMMGGSGSSRPLPLSLSSLLSDVMSTVAREASGMAPGRRGDPELDTPSSSGPEDEDSSSSSSSSWDEQPASSQLRSRHHSLDQNVVDGSQRDESESHFGLSPISSPSGSLLEHLLNAGGAHSHATRRSFGTISQTFKGPDGVTVERVIEMPAQVRQFEMQMGVPAGVRSQSISSRMDESTGSGSLLSSSSSSLGQDRGASFARMMRELSSPDSFSPFAGARPLFSRRPGSLVGKLFRELESDTNEDEGAPSLDRSDAHDPQQSERDESQQDSVESPHWRHEVRRVHIAGPRVLHQLAPHHFSLPATPPSSAQPAAAAAATSGPLKPNADEPPPHSSPSSPLFGFPALKPTFRSPQVVAGVTEPLTAASTSQRQPRAFVYHSNHEISSRHQLDQAARARSASSERPVPPAGAPMVMGRRLDDFVDQRR